MEPELVLRKVARAGAWLDDVERRVAGPAADAVQDDVDLAAFHLQLAVQECVDLAAHWVAAEGWPPPQTSAAALVTLEERAHLDPEVAARMRAAVGLGNRIAHGYADVDRGRFFAECRAGTPLIRRFLLACGEAAVAER